ncbi:MAG: SOS response-associated peptidase [Roseburia sp.]|nr:SOS response-associated peptidase [Roseburia sp.]
MCGRYYLAGAYGTREVAPSEYAPIITEPGAAPCMVKWGYEGRDKGRLIINARGESIRGKPLFGRDYLKRRCLIPADGFFEWDRERRRHCFCGEDKSELFMAGVWTGLPGEAGRFVILTAPANERMRGIHDRMPVLISREEFPAWFGMPEEADALLDGKIMGRQSFLEKKDLETDTGNANIEMYVQQSLAEWLGEAARKV